MRISIVTGPFVGVPPSPAGAVEQIWNGLGVEFAKRGHAVTIVARHDPELPAECRRDGVTYVRRLAFRRTGRIGFDLCKDLAHAVAIQPFIPRADVMVLNSFWLPVVTPWLVPRASRIVYNVARMPKRQMPLYRFVHRLAAVSQAVREEIARQHPASLPRTRVIPNPIHTDVFVPAERGAGDGPRVLLFTGRVHPEKGVHLLVEAFRRLRAEHTDLVLRIIGPTGVADGGGGEPYLATLRSLAAGLPVEFLPAINDRRELARALQAAHLYCYPSLADRGESFGVAPLEAMATGLPTVVSNLACFRDFVRDGENAIVFDHRSEDPVEALRRALHEPLARPDLARRLGAAAADTAAAFGYPRVADMYLADFAELTGAA